MQELFRTDNLVLAWLDDEKTILSSTVFNSFNNWDEVYRLFRIANDALYATPHDVYSILTFQKNTILWPQQAALPNVRNLMQVSPDNEQLIIIVNAGRLLEVTVSLISKVYRMQKLLGKYRFVATLEECNRLIADHKTKRAAQSR